ncbi:unnamed protein product [Sphenostylis stenocarpa]|uniref:Uncharacterized protein n=1 Tax=Sphenostylis stenocarpa TaxID=92480 RepID=A0AA86VYK4_9FABA|nr:unnamed protein product [Sphenostylis stenocarpa]
MSLEEEVAMPASIAWVHEVSMKMEEECANFFLSTWAQKKVNARSLLETKEGKFPNVEWPVCRSGIISRLSDFLMNVKHITLQVEDKPKSHPHR